jgi:hypothetical protein
MTQCAECDGRNGPVVGTWCKSCKDVHHIFCRPCLLWMWRSESQPYEVGVDPGSASGSFAVTWRASDATDIMASP